MDDPIALLTLAQAPGLHAGMLADYLASGSAPATLLDESSAALAALDLPTAVVRDLLHPDTAQLQTGAAWLTAAPHRRLIVWGESSYPHLLGCIPDAPLVLFVEGDPDALLLPQLAIVGSRNPTALGRDTAHDFAHQLAHMGFCITSGLALGIDAASHRGALCAKGRTVAVLGCGLDTVYPRENAALALEILQGQGALVSDLPVGTPPLKHHFPRRNRLISGLSTGTLVVEAALQSGSLITARLAGEQGREVFAIPGSIHNPLARGCHRLLRQGARLVETVADIMLELGAIIGESGVFTPAMNPKATDPASPPLDKEYEILLDALGFEPSSLDQLVVRTGQKAEAVASMLLILELEGRIQQQPGGRYGRTLPGKV
jgi:DNA processing protein